MGSCLIPALIGLILMQFHTNSECYKLEVKPDVGTIIIIRRKSGQVSDCSVCTGEGSTQSCGTELRVKDITTVNFNCSQPGDVYNLEINQEFDCIVSACNNMKAVHPESTRFLDFTRTFTWDVKVQATKTVQLDFPSPGMRQIKPSEQCWNKHTYAIISYQREGPTTIGTFCRNGTVNSIRIHFRSRLSMEVAKGTELNPSDFKVSVGPDATALFEVDAKLPREESSEDYFTPNYAKGFYAKYTIKWNFAVEPVHNFTVKYLDQTEPQCQKGELSVEYSFQDKTVITRKLTDEPPANKMGSFSMTLNSCDAKRDGSGLLLHFEVFVFRGGTPNICSVDLQKDDGLSLQIEKKNSESYCEMKMKSVVHERIVVPTGTKTELSFLDCNVDDLQLTATKTIGCSQGSVCSGSGTDLTLPVLDSCLPVLLHQFTWVLQGSVDLTSPFGNLHQSVPENQCKEKVSFLIYETNGSNLGQFCSVGEGAVPKIQIKGNSSVTMTPNDAKDLSQEKGTFFKAAFNPQITKNTVSVSPPITGYTYLTTPNWPDGMMSSSSVSWLVVVPEDHRANVIIDDISKPECESGSAVVEIQPMFSKENQSWKDNQTVPSVIVQKESFYLNMNNCEQKNGRFAARSKIVLQKDTGKILGIILGVIGGVLFLLITALVAVCVIRRKKKSKNRSSIYMPKGQAFLPGNATFPKTRADNESHVYASIPEDPMTYGHLLNKDQTAVDGDPGAWTNGHQVDTYRPFVGAADPAAAESSPDRDVRAADQSTYQPFLNPNSTFIPPRPRSPLISQSSLGFEDRRMARNELNTFKSAGDNNPIRLSAEESRLHPEPDSDSDSFPEYEPEYEEAM